MNIANRGGEILNLEKRKNHHNTHCLLSVTLPYQLFISIKIQIFAYDKIKSIK